MTYPVTHEKCEDAEIALKSMFLGPQAENAQWTLDIVIQIFSRWFNWRRGLYPSDGAAISSDDQQKAEFLTRRQRTEDAVAQLLNRFEGEIPKFSPRYIGHMFSEISLPALFGHITTLVHNPNNVSRESSRVGLAIEAEAVTELGKMMGISEAFGHFTSGGTVANFEALLRARDRLALWLAAGAFEKQRSAADTSLFEAAHMGWRQFRNISSESILAQIREYNFADAGPLSAAPKIEAAFRSRFQGPVVLVPDHHHYSWQKGVIFLGLGEDALWPVKLGSTGRLSLSHLKQQLERARAMERPVLMVVSVAGTTELGQIDPISEVQDLIDSWRTRFGVEIWHHVDAAFGGFFCSLKNFNPSLSAIRRANSVSLDPHKLGYVPYSSGAFLCNDESDYQVRSFHPPYIQQEAPNKAGSATLEGSRSAAGAVATWLTAKSVGLDERGYGKILERTIRTRERLSKLVPAANPNLRVAPHADTNILCFCYASAGDSLYEASRKTETIYEAFSPVTENPFFASKTHLRKHAFEDYLRNYARSWKGNLTGDGLTLIRLCLMNPFFSSIETRVNYEDEFLNLLKRIKP